MTEDHDQTGRAFAQEPEWDRPDDGGEAVARSEASIEAAEPISQSLFRQSKAVDRSVEELDDVVAELRRLVDARPAEAPPSLRDARPAKLTEQAKVTELVRITKEARPSTAPLLGDSRAQQREVQPPSPQAKAPSAPPPATPTAPAADSIGKPDPIRPMSPRISEPAQRAVSPKEEPARRPEPEILERKTPSALQDAPAKRDQPSARGGEPPTQEIRPLSPRMPEPAQRAVSPKEEPARKPAPEVLERKAPNAPKDAPGKQDQPSARVEPPTQEMKNKPVLPGVTIEGDRGPLLAREVPGGGGPTGTGKGGGGGGGNGGGGAFHKRLGPVDLSASLTAGLRAVKKNLIAVMIFTIATNVLVLAIPVYLFQISDRVLTSRSVDTLVMLTVVIVGAVILQSIFDAIRRFILMRTAVEVAAQLGGPILSAAARASLHSNGREYQTLGDLQQLRTFLVSGTLLSLLDAPMAPLFMLAIFLIHPDLGFIVVATALLLLAITLANQRATAKPFGEANTSQTKANLHVDSMSRNSQIINALAMIPEAVWIWGKDTGNSLKWQVIAQDRNIAFASLSKGVRLLTQVIMLGWGAYLAIEGTVTGGMVIAASIIAGRALGPIEGAIEGWNQVVQSRAAFGRISALLKESPLNFERLKLPRPEGRLDVERLLFVPQGTKRVVLNGIGFGLEAGDSLAIIGNSGAGKTTLGKMLVGSILPTSGSVRLDLMDLRNWDQRQFGESIGYLPQDVQLFPGSIKANIARMREDVDDGAIYEAAKLADVHELIASLPHGYETFVAADGAPLSGGQKQRIALARAFFGSPKLVVLDEPNSNLDTTGELALSRALQQAKEQKITMVTITQRPALLQTVDKILVLVNGTVALFGMRQDVLQALAARGMSLDGGHFGNIQVK
ncbi:type I secretion system permease/ATPase [Mesorhizobium sp.]|uniref:type I secretion system permease/ATPase n=1 Tax=Mesorhizobium sp. TaxID=1871066 RepID=UPI000FE94CD1|nr:type I secretion system permease/ATPase [Mesorhizobium sp.]RWI27738.1 MAG: type I secretion system permease/ATPase [Mesorhizobium sp.]RWK46321.1 MAG: type I secretion system permease/ATPase [Mesorhizobium sp.]RWK89114.1 MAG: type I secretion system permease/ATPase [Mesorhizobium sp.]TIQ27096.1 MAG: type I secretion system permease/ATPase [Mesorhizobium sp.]TJW46426.1 MAG: type I secretion system permease/ATPase [Mesorhizobium sp.]